MSKTTRKRRTRPASIPSDKGPIDQERMSKPIKRKLRIARRSLKALNERRRATSHVVRHHGLNE
jgi:hypothetical protein